MSYLALVKRDAEEAYNHGMTLWALGKLKKPPTYPRVLQDG